MNILVDTDALLALVNPTDALHDQAKALLIELHTKGVIFSLLPTTISEFALLASSRIGLSKTQSVLEVWTQGHGKTILEIDTDLIDLALKMYKKQTSKEESLFDCFIIAAFQTYQFDGLFSFDKGYKKIRQQSLNITLVSELFPNINW